MKLTAENVRDLVRGSSEEELADLILKIDLEVASCDFTMSLFRKFISSLTIDMARVDIGRDLLKLMKEEGVYDPDWSRRISRINQLADEITEEMELIRNG